MKCLLHRIIFRYTDPRCCDWRSVATSGWWWTSNPARSRWTSNDAGGTSNIASRSTSGRELRDFVPLSVETDLRQPVRCPWLILLTADHRSGDGRTWLWVKDVVWQIHCRRFIVAERTGEPNGWRSGLPLLILVWNSIDILNICSIFKTISFGIFNKSSFVWLTEIKLSGGQNPRDNAGGTSGHHAGFLGGSLDNERWR